MKTKVEIVKPPTKHRRIQPTEPLYVHWDGGNTSGKMGIHLHYGEEIEFPHRVYRVSDREFETLERAYKNKSSSFEGSAVFSVETKDKATKKLALTHYVVGRYAQQAGKGNRLLGADKYTRDHFGAFFLAGMLQLHPESHKDVHVVVLHPTDISANSMEDIKKSLGNTHTIVMPDGNRIEYKVTGIIPTEEPVADLQNFILAQDGKPYARPDMVLRPGMEILVLNIGGGLTGFVPCEITSRGAVQVNLSGAPVIQAGIQDVIPVFERELKNKFPELRNIQTLPANMINNALRTGIINISGDDYPCEEQVAAAMPVLSELISDTYRTVFKSGVGFGGLVVGGGGGGAAYNYLRANVLKHKYVYPSMSDLSRIQFGGVIGSMKGTISFLQQQKIAQPDLVTE